MTKLDYALGILLIVALYFNLKAIGLSQRMNDNEQGK